MESGQAVTIYTVGYGTRGFENFVSLLHRFKVTDVVDVRAVPYSTYWVEFRRENLMDSIPKRGFKYVYMGDTLGGIQNSSALCRDPDSVDIEPLFHLPELKRGIPALLKGASMAGKVICLMCGCLRPHNCHRSRLLGRILLEQGFDLVHIDKGDTITRQSELGTSDLDSQQSLF